MTGGSRGDASLLKGTSLPSEALETLRLKEPLSPLEPLFTLMSKTTPALGKGRFKSRFICESVLNILLLGIQYEFGILIVNLMAR